MMYWIWQGQKVGLFFWSLTFFGAAAELRICHSVETQPMTPIRVKTEANQTGIRKVVRYPPDVAFDRDGQSRY